MFFFTFFWSDKNATFWYSVLLKKLSQVSFILLWIKLNVKNDFLMFVFFFINSIQISNFKMLLTNSTWTQFYLLWIQRIKNNKENIHSIIDFILQHSNSKWPTFFPKKQMCLRGDAQIFNFFTNRFVTSVPCLQLSFWQSKPKWLTCGWAWRIISFCNMSIHPNFGPDLSLEFWLAEKRNPDISTHISEQNMNFYVECTRSIDANCPRGRCV